MIAACCGYLALTSTRPARWLVAAGVGGGLVHDQGAGALALPLLAWAAYASLKPRSWAKLVKPHVLPGLAAFLLLVLPWYLAVLNASRTQGAAEAQIGKENRHAAARIAP